MILHSIYDSKVLVPSSEGYYGPGVYLTTYHKGAKPPQVGPTIYDGAGKRKAKKGDMSACVVLQVQKSHLMLCESEDKHHVGYIYSGKMKSPPSIEQVKGKGAKKGKKAEAAAATKKWPKLKITEKMAPKYMMYLEEGGKKRKDVYWREVARVKGARTKEGEDIGFKRGARARGRGAGLVKLATV